MSPNQEVSSLRELTFEAVLWSIYDVILYERQSPPLFTFPLQKLKNTLAEMLGPTIMQELLNSILAKENEIEADIRYLSLRLLLIKGVTVVALGRFPESYYSSVLEEIAGTAETLERLDLTGIWARRGDKVSLCKVLRRLTNVKQLILKYVCDDEQLQIIGRNCQHLERLDISGSDISESALESFVSSHLLSSRNNKMGTSSLQIVNCGGPQHFGATKARLLLRLPNIKSIGSFERTGEAIELLQEEEPASRSGLQYLHDTQTHSRRLSLIVKICPDLRAVYLDYPKANIIDQLATLKCMTELKLSKVCCSDVMKLLEKCGRQVQTLFLFRVWGELDLSAIGILCPNLVRLEFYFVNLTEPQVSLPYNLRKVKELLLLYSDVSVSCAQTIITQCRDVEILSLGECDQLTDESMAACLTNETLQNVESIWFALAIQLTIVTVGLLSEHCPQLRSLGNLAYWNVNPLEMELFRREALLSNLDLTLHEFGCDRDQQQ